ncbi:MAG: tRNA (adenosine(37)-N6)-dimethylallyltransferase MiaA [Acidobacteria bacterium]|nr:tRNA (adenosine(37)-N6)-dimethylallyltransferase MiaA [Acidobacteriota bacterium]
MTDPNKQRPIYAIAGPTASGKTALGVELAERVNGEVLNFDSVQIYKEIEIATAKPSVEEMRGIPHHLIAYVDPRVNYTSADWARDAAGKIAEIESRGKVPVLVGGTGFYLRTLIRPLFESPPTDADLRDRLRQKKDIKGPEHMHRLLTRVDPEAARNLFPRDYVRIIRALEVYFQTGERLSNRQGDREAAPEFAERISVFVLNPPKDDLYSLIDRRTESHFANGLVEEVKRLRAAGVGDATNALGSHGYRRVCEYLRGERTLANAVERTKQDVRNYAKRQLTWFRGEENAHWLNGFGHDRRLVDRILEMPKQKA